MGKFINGYRGEIGGAVQTTYSDQPGVAVPGMIAFASDLSNVDALLISETDGIAAGKGVKAVAIDDDISLQRPNVSVLLPTTGNTVADFVGVLCFDETMQSDEDGVPGYAAGRLGRILKNARAGGRIYVKAVEAIDPATSVVHWVVVAGSDGLYEAGEFAPAALAGSASAGYSTTLASIAKWVTKAEAGDVAIIEFF
jgi:hypothetical protein